MTTFQPKDRPPYVTFAYEAVEDRNESIKQGRYISRDVAFVTVQQPGERDTVVKEAEVWLAEKFAQARDGRYPHDWAEHFQKKFEAWKKGEEIPVNGTPIKTWPAVSPSTTQAILAAGFLSVEDLAAASESQLAALGPGAITIRQKAQAWIDQANSVGKVAEELTSLKILLEEQKRELENLRKANMELKALASVKTEKATA